MLSKPVRQVIGLSGGAKMIVMSSLQGFKRAFSVTARNDRKKIHGIIFGAPGSGKGTISERIVKIFELKHLSSGDLLRAHINQKTEFGAKIAPIVNSGGLVGTELLAPLIDHELKLADSNKCGWLLDGYPRTVDQAALLDKSVAPNAVIYLNVPFATIIDRIKARWVHAPSGRVYNLDYNPPKTPGKDDQTGEPLTQREDDKPESVRKRLELYQKVADPVLDFYRSKNILREFKGTESNVIFPVVQAYLENYFIFVSANS
ncbi:GTP:AMP phosphotransferase AK3, mitochondrial [Orchesella cincta]|uniref:GTP:AMP phosphotransferase, mitochondrial n=1 Tax=Orchesella cincta TaxID=48709 RepID=A0A1D2NMR3_ORCCI|nr:GTP:AMP phosphotransferase AK3, mitochondrial [Orchesella cincta]